ncbi:MAG: aldo/keto reductase [Spirochaetales bacterium]|nr:aldo/keto reductase [Spirochaetales bacterium]
MNLIKRRPFGKTGLQVTQVSLGAMNLRLLPSEKEARELVNYALDRGVNLIDTARAYNGTTGDGKELESEIIVGQEVAKRTDLTEPLIVVTKGHGYNPKAFDEHLNLSREKLGLTVGPEGEILMGRTEIRLVYFFHGISRERWDEIASSGVLEHALKRREEGLFTYLGFSSHTGHEECIAEALDTGVFQVVELPYNCFSPSFGREQERYGNFFRRIHDQGIALINMKAFAGNGMVERTEIFKDYCYISPENRLRFCLSNPWISTVDAGCRFREELDSNLAISAGPAYSEAEQEALIGEAAKVSALIEGTCRECTHCLEKFACPREINFPEILALSARHKMAAGFDQSVDGLKKAYAAIDLQADQCIACGECSPWCEYKLDIPPLMEEAHRLLA